MLSGILVIALPVAIVGSRFQEVYNEMELAKRDESNSYQTDVATKLVARLKSMEGMDPKVNQHVKELSNLIEQSLRQEEILQHLEAREQYLSACVQHQYEDVLKHLDLTYFPWPRRPRAG